MNEELLKETMAESGKRLKERFGITHEHIERAIREFRDQEYEKEKNLTNFQCYKCGKETQYNQDSDDYVDIIKKQSCWTVDLGYAGYGSELDGCDVKFNLCDKCLNEFIGTFLYKNRVYNTGANFRYAE